MPDGFVSALHGNVEPRIQMIRVSKQWSWTGFLKELCFNRVQGVAHLGLQTCQVVVFFFFFLLWPKNWVLWPAVGYLSGSQEDNLPIILMVCGCRIGWVWRLCGSSESSLVVDWWGIKIGPTRFRSELFRGTVPHSGLRTTSCWSNKLQQQAQWKSS